VPTPRRLVIEEIGRDSVARLRPEQLERPVPRVDYESLMYAPGDGSVTRSSLLADHYFESDAPLTELALLEEAMLACERHDSLTGNADFLDALLIYLLKPDD
jgi:hypothetical protein